MSDTPRDPGQSTVDQQKQETEHMDGQEGYGVDYEDGRYTSENMQEAPVGGRSGSYESGNTGGYGSSHPDSNSPRREGEQPTVPADPEAGQGQGGQ